MLDKDELRRLNYDLDGLEHLTLNEIDDALIKGQHIQPKYDVIF